MEHLAARKRPVRSRWISPETASRGAVRSPNSDSEHAEQEHCRSGQYVGLRGVQRISSWWTSVGGAK